MTGSSAEMPATGSTNDQLLQPYYTFPPPTTTITPPPHSSGRPEPCSKLLALPHEVTLRILEYLDIPDLVAISRTCHLLRHLPSDPLLHRQRLSSVPPVLARSLLARPPISAIRPPNANIYLTKTLAAARKVSRDMVRLRLRQKLGLRPPLTVLVDRGVLPGECLVLVVVGSQKGGDGCGGEVSGGSDSNGQVNGQISRSSVSSATTASHSEQEIGRPRPGSSSTLVNCRSGGGSSGGHVEARPKYVSPRFIEAKRAVEREAIRDKIRNWVDGRGREEMERRRRETELEIERRGHHGAFLSSDGIGDGDGDGATGRGSGVKGIVRRIRAQCSREAARGGERWGRGAARWAERRRREPTRAHVLGLRRFWENVATGHA